MIWSPPQSRVTSLKSHYNWLGQNQFFYLFENLKNEKCQAASWIEYIMWQNQHQLDINGSTAGSSSSAALWKSCLPYCFLKSALDMIEKLVTPLANTLHTVESTVDNKCQNLSVQRRLTLEGTIVKSSSLSGSAWCENIRPVPLMDWPPRSPIDCSLLMQVKTVNVY